MVLHLETQRVTCGMISRTTRLIAIDENTGKLAVVRKSSTPEVHDYVEFYSILTGWLAVPELTVCPENGSIEHLMFTGNGELMSSHANGSVCFIDPHNSQRVKRIQISASSIWAACKHDQNKVSLISHSSVLYFLDVNSKMITSSVSLGVESRLFDVSSDSNLIAIGSIDGIILAGNGKVQNTLKLDRASRRDPTIAWTVLFIKPSVLAAGDSRGTVTIWNTSEGSLIQSISCLQSHILTMCLNEGSLNVSGVDPRIAVIKQSNNGQYEVVNRRSGPSRDIRTLAVYENSVYAAGEDFDIFVFKDGCRKLYIQHKEDVIVSTDIVATAGENYIDVFWKQPGEEETVEEEKIIRQHYEMVHLAKIFSPKKKIITCWALNSTGENLAIGTSNETTVYKLNPSARKMRNKVIKTATLAITPTALGFYNNRLYASKADFEIIEVSLTNPVKEPRSVLTQDGCGSVTKIRTSPDGNTLCVMNTRSQVFVVNIQTGNSRLVRVELPIDIIIASSIFVLSSHTDLCDTRKVFHEVGGNGVVKRSASSHQLKMVPTSPKLPVPGFPVALHVIDNNKIMAVSYDGHWSIIDTKENSVVSALDCPTEGKREQSLSMVAVRAHNNSKTQEVNQSCRIIKMDVLQDAVPKTCAFKLKKFGMQ